MTAPPPDHLEVEWQYDALVLEPIIEWLNVAQVPGYTVTPIKVREVRDTYYDTADWRIFRGGFTCRLRHDVEGGGELTLKSMATAKDGLRSRREMNELLTEGQRRPEEGAGLCSEAVRLMAGRRHVEALFTLHQKRHTYDLADGLGRIGEISVDETTIELSGQSLRRVELEVAPEAVARAERFRGVLVAVGSLQPATTSKYEAALQAAGIHPAPTETTLGSTEISASMGAGQVAFAVMRRHFATFLANEPGTRLGEDIEALHDMRVAARRLRAAMQAFRPWLPVRAQRFRNELGYVGRALGEVRDLDVFLETLESWEHDDPEHAEALAAIGTVLQARRNVARSRMLTVLDRRRYDIFVERFAAWLRHGSPVSFVAGRQPILAVAPGLVEKRYARVRKLANAITAESPPADYHNLRIEGKKLRYAVEFVTPVYGQPATDFAKQLTALQDVLGLHQDAYVAMDLLGELASTSGRRLGPETVLAMGSVQERYRRDAANLRGQFPRVYKPMRKRWRALRSTMDSRVPPAPVLAKVTAGAAGR